MTLYDCTFILVSAFLHTHFVDTVDSSGPHSLSYNITGFILYNTYCLNGVYLPEHYPSWPSRLWGLKSFMYYSFKFSFLFWHHILPSAYSTAFFPLTGFGADFLSYFSCLLADSNTCKFVVFGVRNIHLFLQALDRAKPDTEKAKKSSPSRSFKRMVRHLIYLISTSNHFLSSNLFFRYIVIEPQGWQ